MPEQQTLSVLKTSPRRFDTVPVDTLIEIFFSVPLDESSVTISTVILLENAISPISGVVEYDNIQKKVTFTPNSILSPEVPYTVHIVGDSSLGGDPGLVIKDALGNPFLGNYVFTFTTTTAQRPGIPNLISPSDQIQLDATPEFRWSLVPSAGSYEIQVSNSNLFAPVIWPTIDNPIDQPGSGTEVSVTPDVDLLDGLYYWRIRAVSEDGIKGNYSEVWRFRKGILFAEIIPEPIESFPPLKGFDAISTDFLVTDTKPKTFTIIPTGLPDIQVEFNRIPDLNTLIFDIFSRPVDGDPFVSETEIIPSGVFLIPPSGMLLDFPIPSGSLELNKEIILTIHELISANPVPIPEELIFTFFTPFDPLIVSHKLIRVDLGDLISDKTDLELMKLIYVVSKDALDMATSEIADAYDQGIIDPSLKCWVRYKVDKILLQEALTALLGVGNIQEALGDFSLRRGLPGGPEIKEIAGSLDKNLRDCENLLTGANTGRVRVPKTPKRGEIKEPDRPTRMDSDSLINL